MFGLGNRSSSRRNYSAGGGNHMLRNAALAGLGMMAYRWFRNRQTTSAQRDTASQRTASGTTAPKDVW